MTLVVKWVIGIAILAVGGVATYLILNHRNDDAISRQVYEDSIAKLQKRFDSLGNVIQSNTAVAASIRHVIDSARKQDSVYENTIANQKAQIKKLKADYAKNNIVNTFDRDKLLQLVSDSLTPAAERH